MSFEEFQDGSHLGYRNGMILAILNLSVTVMPPIKFQLNQTEFGRRCCLKNFKMAAILDIGTEQILAILNLHVATMPPTKFQLNPTYGSGGNDEICKANDGWTDGWTQHKHKNCIS